MTPIEHVQTRLIELGWYGGGKIDGVLGDQLKDEILAFRRRSNIPLTAESGEPLFIDDELMDALRVAAPKMKTLEQVTATAEKIAPKIEAVAENNKSIKTAWWTRLFAFITGIPAAIFGLLNLIISQSDQAIAIITPIRAMFPEVPFYWWMIGGGVVVTVLGVGVHFTKVQSQKTEEKLVEKFKEGTLAPDPKVPEPNA